MKKVFISIIFFVSTFWGFSQNDSTYKILDLFWKGTEMDCFFEPTNYQEGTIPSYTDSVLYCKRFEFYNTNTKGICYLKYYDIEGRIQSHGPTKKKHFIATLKRGKMTTYRPIGIWTEYNYLTNEISYFKCHSKRNKTLKILIKREKIVNL